MKSAIFLFVVLISVVTAKAPAPKKCKAAEKCTVLCNLQKAGKMDDNAEVILKKFVDKNKKQAATECATKNKQEDLCDRGVGFNKCFHKALANITAVDNSNKCANETNTVVDATKAAQAVHKFDDKKACYLRCMLIKTKLLNELNEVDFNKLGAKPYKDDVSKVCYEANKQEDTCLQAIRRVTCVTKKVAQKRKEAKAKAVKEAKAAKAAKQAKAKNDKEVKTNNDKDSKEAKSE